MTPSQTSQSRGMPGVPIGIYCSPVTVQRGGLWLILWQLSLSDRSLGPLLYLVKCIPLTRQLRNRTVDPWLFGLPLLR